MFVGAIDDVVVREDVAVGRDDDAGAERVLTRRILTRAALAALTALVELLAEEAAQEVVRILALTVLVVKPGHGGLRFAFRTNRHHCGSGDADDVRVGIATAGDRRAQSVWSRWPSVRERPDRPPPARARRRRS